VWLNDIIERDGMDLTSALFSESTARAIVTVPREDDVKFSGLCEARGYPVLRIGVTDGRGPEATLHVQDVFTVPVAEIRERSNATLPRFFA
jgi:phosphoribosylformylglycinamidine synthase